MVELHPEKLSKNGKSFVVLPQEEFDAIQEALEELEDIRALDEAIAAEKDAPSIPWAKAKKKLGLA
jgi:hypothetical protein